MVSAITNAACDSDVNILSYKSNKKIAKLGNNSACSDRNEVALALIQLNPIHKKGAIKFFLLSLVKEKPWGDKKDLSMKKNII